MLLRLSVMQEFPLLKSHGAIEITAPEQRSPGQYGFSFRVQQVLPVNDTVLGQGYAQ